MPEIKRGSYSINLGVFQMSAEVSEDDRQCAWELYTELSTRISLIGKSGDKSCTNFTGEVLVESLDSVHRFFREARSIMRKFPVGRLPSDRKQHLGCLISEFMVRVLRPFLEKWQSEYRHWWETQADKTLPPLERQKRYPLRRLFEHPLLCFLGEIINVVLCHEDFYAMHELLCRLGVPG